MISTWNQHGPKSHLEPFSWNKIWHMSWFWAGWQYWKKNLGPTMKMSGEIIWLLNSCVTSKRIEITYLALCLYILVPWIWPSLSFNYACLIFLAVCTFETLTYKWELYSQNMYLLVAVTSSGILKAKQKLGITFDSDKLGGIDFTKFSKLTMCSA